MSGAKHETKHAWAKRRTWWNQLVATGTIRCTRCPELIAPGDEWDLDHFLDDGVDAHTAPSHRWCNRRFGLIAQINSQLESKFPPINTNTLGKCDKSLVDEVIRRLF